MVKINVVYTKAGDDGSTSLADGIRITKTAPRIDTIGTIDELNAHIGVAIANLSKAGGFAESQNQLARIQNELFNLGAELAMLLTDANSEHPCIVADNVELLEHDIDQLNQDLNPLDSFILPSGSLITAQLHVCRTVCRRAERTLVQLAEQDTIRPVAMQYLNRLSDWLFVLARWVQHQLHLSEKLWIPPTKG